MAVSTDEIETRISELYVGLIGRAPDRDGLNFWAAGYRNRLERGQSDSESLTGIAQAMFESAGARTYYPEGASERGIVEQFYQNVLGRVGDDQGIGFWTDALGSSRQTGDVLVEMIEAVKNFTGDDPAGQTSQTLFSKKATVAVHYGTEVSQSGQAAIDEASAILDAVNVETDVADDTALGTFISSVEPAGSDGAGDSGGSDGSDGSTDQRLTSAEAKTLLARDALSPSDNGLFVVYADGDHTVQPSVDQRLTASELDTALSAFDYVVVYDLLGPGGPITVDTGEYLSLSAGDVVSEAGSGGQVSGAGTLEVRLFSETAQFPNIATYGFDLTNVSGELNLKGVITGSEQGGAIDITGFDAAEVESFRRLESIEFDEPFGNAITLAGDLESLTSQTINAGGASDVGVRIERINADNVSILDTSGMFADTPSAGALSLVLDEEAGEVDFRQALDITGVDKVVVPTGTKALIPATKFDTDAPKLAVEGEGDLRITDYGGQPLVLSGVTVAGSTEYEATGGDQRLTSSEAKELLADELLEPVDGGLRVVYEGGDYVYDPQVDGRLTADEVDAALGAFEFVALFDQLGPSGPLTIESGEYLSASAGDVVAAAGTNGQVDGSGTLQIRLFPETEMFPNVGEFGFDLTDVSTDLKLVGFITGEEQGGEIDLTGFSPAEVESFQRLETIEFGSVFGDGVTLVGNAETLTGQTIDAGDASDLGVRIERINADSVSILDTSAIFADAPSAGTLSLVLDEEAGAVDLQQALDISGVDTIEIPVGVTAVIPASAFSGGATPVTASGAGNVRVVGVDEATTGLDGLQVTGDVTLETAGASADGSSESIALSLPADLLDRNPENNPSPFSSVEILGDSLGVVRLRGADDSSQVAGSRDFGHVSVQSGVDVDIPLTGAVNIEGTSSPDAFKLTETLTDGSSLSGGADSFGSGIVFGENPATPVESIPVDIDMTSVSFDAVRRLFLEGDGTEVTFGGEQLGGQAIDINTMNATEGERTSESGSGANGQTLIIDIEGQGGTSTSTDFSELTFSNFDTAAGLFRWNGGEDTLRINGGVADDEIIGTAVADIVNGGKGADIFEYAPGQGGGFPSEIPNTDAPESQDRIVKFDGPVDEITDFVFGEDVLSLTSEAIESGRLSTLEDFKLADQADVGISFGNYDADNPSFTYTTTSDYMPNASLGAEKAGAMDVLVYADEEKSWDADPSDATASWLVLTSPTGPDGRYLTAEADMML